MISMLLKIELFDDDVVVVDDDDDDNGFQGIIVHIVANILFASSNRHLR